MDGRELTIIAIPFREGGHVANKPSAFLPVIDHLQELHEKGYVHGDIRAYNTVFGNPSAPAPAAAAEAEAEAAAHAAVATARATAATAPAPGAAPGATPAAAAIHTEKKEDRSQNINDDKAEDWNPESWLIDFDFGGKEDETLLYPDGYEGVLPDGSRVGNQKEQICKWHDWYALGMLIFSVHELRGTDPEGSINDMKDKRTRDLKQSKQPPSYEDINELKRFLNDEKWNVVTGAQFYVDLKKVTPQDTGKIKRHHGATGTPFKK